MKVFALLFTTLLLQFTQGNLTPDFISGFETGVFLRDDNNALMDYSCPRPESNDVFGKQIKGLITPMKLMGNMMQDAKVDQIILAVETFASGLIDLMAVFRGDYDYGDFCSGLVFGIDGAKILLALADQFVKHSDK